MAGARTRSVTLRIDVNVNDTLDRFCCGEGLTKSLVVNSALAAFLRRPARGRIDVVKEYVERAKNRR